MNRIALLILIGIVFAGSADAQQGGNHSEESVYIDTNHCSYLVQIYEGEGTSGEFQKAYDTSRTFIEQCAELSFSYNNLEEIGPYNTQRSDDRHRFEEYREWLKKVLYLNTSSNYYCADAGQILSTFHWFNDQRGNDGRGELSVLYFLLESGKCPEDSIYLNNAISNTWIGLYNSWYDTVSDPPQAPFDSILPSLEDLDLGILRGNPAGVHGLLNPHSLALATLTATENPFKNETSLNIETNDAVLLHLEIFDVLGRKLFSDAKFFEEGKERWMIEGKDLPRGTLYARISTLSGEARTVKLVHE